MKINAIVLFLFVFSLCACFDDKGNYDYREVAEITIENVPEVIEVLGNSDHIVVKPKVVSSLEGEITGDNANFEFSYKIEIKGGGTIESGQRWVDLNPAKTLDLDTLAAFVANTYIGWLNVRECRPLPRLISRCPPRLTRGGWCCATRGNRNGCGWI